ncbi:hypothetical protein V1226_09555 [Lachnospiraceae bacterium JLR.KK009]|nr:hypothetical protein C810_01722 [Lachnospiraceae bacterium A2]
MGNFTKEDIRESSRLKEKACENCMGKLKGTVSEEEKQQFREAFYTASEGYLFRKKGSSVKAG